MGVVCWVTLVGWTTGRAQFLPGDSIVEGVTVGVTCHENLVGWVFWETGRARFLSGDNIVEWEGKVERWEAK